METQAVPELRPAVIEAVKARALRAGPKEQRARARSLRTTANSRRSWVSKGSGFVHPGATYAGPEEIAHLQMRLEAGVQPQVAARRSLLTVRGARGRGAKRGGGRAGFEARLWAGSAGTQPGPRSRTCKATRRCGLTQAARRLAPPQPLSKTTTTPSHKTSKPPASR